VEKVRRESASRRDDGTVTSVTINLFVLHHHALGGVGGYIILTHGPTIGPISLLLVGYPECPISEGPCLGLNPAPTLRLPLCDYPAFFHLWCAPYRASPCSHRESGFLFHVSYRMCFFSVFLSFLNHILPCGRPPNPPGSARACPSPNSVICFWVSVLLRHGLFSGMRCVLNGMVRPEILGNRSKINLHLHLRCVASDPPSIQPY
jgi:hypothetical protein